MLKKLQDTASLLALYKKPTIPSEKYQARLYSDEGKSVLQYLQDVRGFDVATLKHFKIGASEEDEVVVPVFKDSDLIDYKYRSIPPRDKSFRRWPESETWIVNESCMNLATEKDYLIITEGEMDCMALWQLGFKPVISSTGGAQGKTEWVGIIPDQIKKIYINYDNDEVGQENARRVAERLGIERCYNVVLPTKDANEFLLSGGTMQQFAQLLNNAKRFEIKDVYKVVDIIADLQKNKIQRAPTFLERFNIHTKGGIPRKSLVVMSGRTGIGKSTALMNFLIHHANNGKPVLLVSLENDVYFTIQRILEIKYKKEVISFTDSDWEHVKKELVDYPFYIDVSMSRYSMSELRSITDQAKKLYGIEFLGFDHIGFLPNRSNSVGELSDMVRDFKILAREEDIIVYLISHIRKVDPNNPIITGEDLKGTSSLQQDADMVLLLYHTREGLEMNIDKSRASKSHVRIPIVLHGECGLIIDDMSRKAQDFNGELDDIIDDVDFLPKTEETKSIDDIDY